MFDLEPYYVSVFPLLHDLSILQNLFLLKPSKFISIIFSTMMMTTTTIAGPTAWSACATSATPSSCRAGISVFALRVPKV